MANTKNQHIFPKDRGWIVRREGTNKFFKFFKYKEDAIEYAGILASKDQGSIIIHNYDGQFKGFIPGYKIHVRKHKISPIITGTLEITPPIVENPRTIIETMTSI